MRRMAKREKWVVFAIFLLALFLRWYQLDLTILGADIVRDLDFTTKMYETRDFYLGGFREGTGDLQETFGPLEYYLILPIIMVSKSPVVVAGFIALLSSLAVVLCFMFCHRFFSRRVAIIASLLYAVNPWAVFYSRFLWNPNFIPFFTMWFMYSLFKAKVEKKRWYLVAASAALGALVQFHQITFFLFPLLLFVMGKKNARQIVVGSFIFLLFLAPYIIHNVQTGTSLLQPMTGFAQERPQENPQVINVRDSVAMPIMLATNYYGKFMFGEKQISENNLVNGFFYGITIIMVILLLVSGVYVVLQYMKQRQIEYKLLLAWLLIPIAGYILLNRNISPHYGLILYPVQFILIGVFIDKIKKARVLILFFVLLIVVANAAYILLFYNFLEREGGTTAAYGIPYRYKYDAVKYIIEMSKNEVPRVFFLKNVKRDFRYILEDVFGVMPKYGTIEKGNGTAGEVNGFLVVDRLSRYGYAERELSEQEWLVFERVKKGKKFGGIEVTSLPLRE